MNNTATIQLVGVNGGLVTPFSTTTGGSINCVWSPDGSQILYTQGVFGAGDLTLRDTSGNIQSVPSTWKAPEHFDGNSDWATNFSPKCDPKLAQIGVNQFTTIKLSCTDPDFGFGKEPPTPTPLESDALEIVTGPSHGTIGGLSDDGKVIYTPNKDFQGSDAFTYTGTDGTSEACRRASRSRSARNRRRATGRRRRFRESASRPRDGALAALWRRSRKRRSGPRSPSASARRRGRRSPSSDRAPGAGRARTASNRRAATRGTRDAPATSMPAASAPTPRPARTRCASRVS